MLALIVIITRVKSSRDMGVSICYDDIVSSRVRNSPRYEP